MLAAQADPAVPQRFNSSQQEKQDMLNAMEAEEEVSATRCNQQRDRRELMNTPYRH